MAVEIDFKEVGVMNGLKFENKSDCASQSDFLSVLVIIARYNCVRLDFYLRGSVSL